MKERTDVRIVLLQIRTDTEELAIECDAFLRSTGLSPQCLVPVDVVRTTPRAQLLDFADALIIGGSVYSVFEDVPHLEEMKMLLRTARAREIPTLGICFGAQLIADVYGGDVRRDKSTEEVGTQELRKTADAEADVLLSRLPVVFMAQCAHQDRIFSVPDGAVVLAESELCPVQAFTFPEEMVYGIQFHPERSKADFQRFITLRKADYGGDAQDLDDAYETLADTPDTELILRRFARILTKSQASV